jgi:hypothetical protein
VYVPPIVGVNTIVPSAPAGAALNATDEVNTHVPAATEIEVISPATSAPAVHKTPEVKSVPLGSRTLNVVTSGVTEVTVVPVIVAVGVTVTADPTKPGVAPALELTPPVVAVYVYATVTVAAFAGTTDKSPNPSEATATADTFFNEIVFTIFLSFSQIKEFLLPGW